MLIEREKRVAVIDVCLLVFFVLIVYSGWLRPGTIARTDLFLPTEEWLREWLNSPYLWSYEGGGFPQPVYELQQYPLFLLWAALHFYLGVDIDWGRRLIWAFPFLIFSVTSMYYLTYILFKNRIISRCAALYFPLSSMIFWAARGDWIQGVASCSVLPFVLAFFIRGVNESRNVFNRQLLIAGLFMGVSIWYEMKIAILGIAIILLCAIYLSCLSASFKDALRIIAAFVIVCATAAILNAHVILPNFVNPETGVPLGAVSSGTLSSSVDTKLVYVLNFTYYALVRNGQIYLFPSIIIAALAFLTIFFRPKCKWTLFFLILAIILIFFAKGATQPFGELLRLSIRNIPGFIIFRDVNKALLVLTIPASVLIGISVSEIYSRLAKRRTLFIGGYICVVLATILPFFIGNRSIYNDPAGSSLNPKPIPESHKVVQNWIAKQPAGYKTLLFPSKSAIAFTSQRHPALYGAIYIQEPFGMLERFLWLKEYERDTALSRGEIQGFGPILAKLNISNIVVLPEEDYFWQITPGGIGRKELLRLLDRQKGLNKENLTDDVTIYKVKAPMQLISMPQKSAVIIGGLSAYLPIGRFTNIAEWSLLFLSQIKKDKSELLDKIDNIVFYRKDNSDLFADIIDDKYKVNFWQYAGNPMGITTTARSHNTWDGAERMWIRYFTPYFATRWGEIPEGGGGLVQAGNPTHDEPLKFSVDISDSGLHEVWIRMGVGDTKWVDKNCGEVAVSIDYALFKYINGCEFVPGLKWLRLGETNLGKGEHIFTIINRSGINALDQIVIIPQSVADDTRRMAEKALSRKNIVYFWEPDKDFVSEVIYGRGGDLQLLKNASFEDIKEGNMMWKTIKTLDVEPVVSGAKDGRIAWLLKPKEFESAISQVFSISEDKRLTNSTITFGVWARTDRESGNIKLAIHNNYHSQNLRNNVKTYNNVSKKWQFFTVSARIGSSYHDLRAYIFPDDGNSGGSVNDIYIDGAVVVKGKINEDNLNLQKEFDVTIDGTYKVFLEVESESFDGQVRISVDDREIDIFPIRFNSKEVKFIETKGIVLGKGKHRLTILKKGKGFLKFRLAALHNFMNPLLRELNYNVTAIDSVKWNMTSHNALEAHANSTKSGFLTLSTNYHLFWHAQVDEKEITPLPVDGFANGFWLEPSGSIVRIEYGAGKYLQLGWLILLSAIGFIVLIVVVIRK
ncbi:MAG: hypothetical protein HZC11_04995 [Nitrospirae bacterium]|nr:hypothetical protein [Nitrospirota bacterium]